MNINTNVNDNVLIQLYSSDGALKTCLSLHNAVTIAGKSGIANQILASSTMAKPGWMELGTGSPSTTLLGSYISGSRVALTSKTQTSTNVITMVGDFPAGIGTGAITEAGIFNVATSNATDMWFSSSFATVTKSSGDTLQITWTLTVS